MIQVKILSLGDPERYTVRRLVTSVEQALLAEFPGLQLRISEIDQAVEIGRYAQVLVMPTLIINEKMVCSGRYPSRDEILNWLREAIDQN